MSPAIVKKLKAAAIRFAFDQVPKEGESLLLVGHPVAGNSKQLLLLSQDQDCRVVSKTSDVRLLDDPDQINPNGYSY